MILERKNKTLLDYSKEKIHKGEGVDYLEIWNDIVEWSVNNRSLSESQVESFWNQTLVEDCGYRQKSMR